MSRAPIALVVLLFALAGCGGDDGEAAPREWCRQTLHLDHQIKRLAAAIDLGSLQRWTDRAPEDVRAKVEQAADFYGTHPIDPSNPEFEAVRAELRAYVADRCPEGCSRLEC
jgi:hypothetical protein